MPDTPLTVLHLTHQGDGAGSTQSIFSLSRALAERGHRVLLGCRDESLLARLGRGAGIGVVPLDFRRIGALAGALARVAARERVDVVNAHATRDRRALTWLRWRGRLPQAFVATRRTMPRTSPVELAAVGWTADRTIAVSDAVARALRRRGQPRARLAVVPNGIELARVDAGASPEAAAEARGLLGDVAGRAVVLVVSRRKDQDVLLRALPRVGRPVLLACVGVDADAELARLAAALPERHRAVFIPFLANPLGFYRLAAVAALPSRIEGLSQALLEAMALGVPVLASDAGGNPDLVSPDRTGLLVAPRDPAAWARALERLLGEADLARRLADAARRDVREAYSIARTAERTVAVYRDALARRRLLRGEAAG